MNLGRLWDGLAEDLDREHRKFRHHLSGLNVSVKPDSTLLTDADLAMESLILEHIRWFDADPVVVAEEDERHVIRSEILERPGRIWVIDPIDGTAEFVKQDSRQFCSVVCLLEDLEPVSAFVFAPELGRGATPMASTRSARAGPPVRAGRAPAVRRALLGTTCPRASDRGHRHAPPARPGSAVRRGAQPCSGAHQAP